VEDYNGFTSTIFQLQSTQERIPHQAAWLYQAVVERKEVTLAISKGGKRLHIFLVASD
jgi:hypothetical protein